MQEHKKFIQEVNRVLLLLQQKTLDGFTENH